MNIFKKLVFYIILTFTFFCLISILYFKRLLIFNRKNTNWIKSEKIILKIQKTHGTSQGLIISSAKKKMPIMLIISCLFFLLNKINLQSKDNIKISSTKYEMN